MSITVLSLLNQPLMSSHILDWYTDKLRITLSTLSHNTLSLACFQLATKMAELGMPFEVLLVLLVFNKGDKEKYALAMAAADS